MSHLPSLTVPESDLIAIPPQTGGPLLTTDVESVVSLAQSGAIDNYSVLLPMLLQLRNRPFSLHKHIQFEPMFRITDVPQRQIFVCGRQVGKSTCLAARQVLRLATNPYRSLLYVAPLFDQTRRFSNNYVRPFLEYGPLHDILLKKADGSAVDSNNVLQRTMGNESTLHLEYCGDPGADRVRGIPTDYLDLDELQDLAWEALPVLGETLSASDLALQTFTGTAKGTSSAIYTLQTQSSMAEWAIRCDCGEWNIACLECGLDDMVQKHGLACRKCMRLLNTRMGVWVHRYPDRRSTFDGRHIPQPILPLHCENPRKWYMLYHDKKMKYPRPKYLNEVLGETCDVGTSLITRTQIRAVCTLPWGHEDRGSLAHLGNYPVVTMGIDWGLGAGGQVKRRRGVLVVEEGSPSFTVPVICGFRYGQLDADLLYARRMPVGIEPHEEVKQLLDLARQYQVKIIAHDFGGAGALRESMLLQAGFPADALMPMSYTGNTAQAIVRYMEPTDISVRRYWGVDKSRSLSLLILAIKAGMIRFSQWSESDDNIVEDLLALYEDWQERDSGSAILRIRRDPRRTDDFCHGLNMACVAHWHSIQAYPDLADKFGVRSFNEVVD